ncbi:DUF2911 domain-containing protein [Mucilaginibacter sp. HD30]
MKKVFQLVATTCFAFALFLTSSTAFAQGAKPMASPRDSVSAKVAGATISINYGSPSVKGRKIFGGLEPYGKLWRAGANQATVFTTDKDITVEGKKLAAGKYTFFAMPGEKEWKIVFNSQVGQWGINGQGANADPAKNVLEATVNAKTAPATERLKYVITASGFSLIWENTEVPVSIK